MIEGTQPVKKHVILGLCSPAMAFCCLLLAFAVLSGCSGNGASANLNDAGNSLNVTSDAKSSAGSSSSSGSTDGSSAGDNAADSSAGQSASPSPTIDLANGWRKSSDTLYSNLSLNASINIMSMPNDLGQPLDDYARQELDGLKSLNNGAKFTDITHIRVDGLDAVGYSYTMKDGSYYRYVDFFDETSIYGITMHVLNSKDVKAADADFDAMIGTLSIK